MKVNDKTTCLDVEAWWDLSGSNEDVDIIEHIVGCVRCRSWLVIKTIELRGLGSITILKPGEDTKITCAEVGSNLPAFIDLVETQGDTAAYTAYQRVWWHLLVCGQCADLYDAVMGSLTEIASKGGDPGHCQNR